MRMRILIVGCAALFAAALGGCGALKQAQVHQRMADTSDAAADRIDAGLARLEDPGGTGAAPDPAMVRAWLPAAWLDAFDRAVAAGHSATDAAAAISAELRTLAETNRAQAEQLRLAVADGADQWTLYAQQAGAVAAGVNPVLGLATTAVAGIAGVVAAWQRGKTRGRGEGLVSGLREGARQTAEIVNAGLYADEKMREAVKEGRAGEAMRSVLNNSTDPVVAAAVLNTKM